MFGRRARAVAFESQWLTFCLVAAGFQLFPACTNSADPLGGQTGDGSDLDVPPGTPDQDVVPVASITAHDCKFESEPIDDPDEAVDELGFAPSQLLQLLEEPYETSLAWGTNGEPGAGPEVTVGPETGVSGLQVAFSYRGGAINLLTAASPESDAGAASGGEAASSETTQVPCPPELELEVELQIRSDGGALDETVTTMVRARTPDIASFSHQVAAEDIEGELMLTGESASDWPLAQFEFRGVIAEYGTNGTINVVRVNEASSQNSSPVPSEEGELDPEDVGMHQAVAVWPAPGECVGDSHASGAGGGIVVESDQDLGEFSAADARGVFDGVTEIPITWDSDQETQLTLEVNANGSTCAWPDGSGATSVAFPASVDLASEDERIDGSYDAAVHVTTGAERELAFASLSILLEEIDPDEAAQRFGVADDISFEGFDSASLNINLTRELTTDDFFGTVVVYGSKRVECEDDLRQPPSDEDDPFAVSPCEHSKSATLLEGNIGQRFESEVVQSEEASQPSLPRPEP